MPWLIKSRKLLNIPFLHFFFYLFVTFIWTSIDNLCIYKHVYVRCNMYISSFFLIEMHSHPPGRVMSTSWNEVEGKFMEKVGFFSLFQQQAWQVIKTSRFSSLLPYIKLLLWLCCSIYDLSIIFCEIQMFKYPWNWNTLRYTNVITIFKEDINNI